MNDEQVAQLEQAAPPEQAVQANTANPGNTPLAYYEIRLRFARREPAIWLAHLDMMRTFERAIRRAKLPVHWSQGFNPRPQMTFALPIGVGLATEDDYVDIQLIEPVAPDLMIKKLNDNLPIGFEILAGAPILPSKISLMSLVQAADYRLSIAGLAAAWRRIPVAQPLIVEKFSKGRTLQVEIRALILDVRLMSESEIVIRVKAGSSANLRPDLFLDALVVYGGLDAIAAADCAITRLSLLIHSTIDPSGYASPLRLPQ
ncbi:MAG: TIGR03936 family radical SAM-associated protein [Eubacteriales bacterium]|nr:TIGR03936 family radical SAM-associated protein [Eubacteriales bacterium]